MIIQHVAAMVEAGFLAVNEARELLGLSTKIDEMPWWETKVDEPLS